MSSPVRKVTGILLFLLLPLSSAHADSVDLEINKVEQRDSGCLFYLLTKNDSAQNYASLKLDMVLFDEADLIQRRIGIDMAPLKAGKTSVKMFEVPGSQCKSIAKILINEVVECADENGPANGCLDLLNPASRVDVNLFL